MVWLTGKRYVNEKVPNWVKYKQLALRKHFVFLEVVKYIKIRWQKCPRFSNWILKLYAANGIS